MKKKIMLMITFIFTMQACANLSDPYGRLSDDIFVIQGPLIENNEKEQNENIKTETKVVVSPNKEEGTKNKIELKSELKVNKAEETNVNKTKLVENNKVPQQKESFSTEKKSVNREDYKNIPIFTAEIRPENKKEIKTEKKEMVKVVLKDEKVLKEEATRIETVEAKDKITTKVENKTETKVETKAETVEKPKYIKEDYRQIELSEKDIKVLKLIKKYYKILESYEIMELKAKELIVKERIKENRMVPTLDVIRQIHEKIKEIKTRSFVIAISKVQQDRGIK